MIDKKIIPGHETSEQLEYVKQWKEADDVETTTKKILYDFELKIKEFKKTKTSSKKRKKTSPKKEEKASAKKRKKASSKKKPIDYSSFKPTNEFINLINYLFDYTDIIKKNTKFFRARLINNSDVTKLHLTNSNEKTTGLFGFYKKEMGMPPAFKAGANRASPKGKPLMYVSSNAGRACMEIRPIYDAKISLMKYKLKKDIKVINLINDKIDYKLESERIKVKLLIEWVQFLFAKPVCDNSDIDYTPTQYISYYIQVKLREHQIAGIKYGLTNDALDNYNLVLFSPSYLQPLNPYGKLLKCISQKFRFVNYSNKKPNDYIRSNFSWPARLSQEKWDEKVKDMSKLMHIQRYLSSSSSK
jgi:hypothetical protein